jgi:hypothetical protein
MANIDLRFLCLESNFDYIKCEKDDSGVPECIKIICLNGDTRTSIYLDKSTAIRFAKTLRTEINKIQ